MFIETNGGETEKIERAPKIIIVEMLLNAHIMGVRVTRAPWIIVSHGFSMAQWHVIFAGETADSCSFDMECTLLESNSLEPY